MSILHLRGSTLDLSLYRLAAISLKDDYEDVRMSGLHLVWSALILRNQRYIIAKLNSIFLSSLLFAFRILSNIYPNHLMVLTHEGTEKQIRMLDDAFVKICDMVNDISVNVRIKASLSLSLFNSIYVNKIYFLLLLYI